MGAGGGLYLTRTDPLAGGDAWRISARQNGGEVEITFPQIANRGFMVEWTATLSSGATWQPLDAPANRPFFSANDFTATVIDAIPGTPFKFYRVRVFEP